MSVKEEGKREGAGRRKQRKRIFLSLTPKMADTSSEDKI